MKNSTTQDLHLFLIALVFLIGQRVSAQYLPSGSIQGFMLQNTQRGYNSALYGLNNHPYLSMRLPSFTAALGNNTYSPSFISDTFAEGEWLTEHDKADVIDQIESENVRLFGRGYAGVFGMNIDKYGFSIFDYYSQTTGIVPQDIIELVMNGWEEDKIYKFDDVEWEAFNYWTLSFYISKSLFPPRGFEDFSVSAAFKYARGTHYWGLGYTRAYFQVQDTTINAEGLFEYLSSKAGDGLGLDLSAAGYFKSLESYVGLTLGNIVGSINWSNVRIEELSFERHKGVHPDSMLKTEYWETFFNKSDTSYSIGSLTTPLPRYLQLTVYRPATIFKGHGDLYGGICQALNEAPGQSLTPKLFLGTYLNWKQKFHLIGDLAIGGIEGFELGGGIGVTINGYQSNLYGSWQRGILWGAKGFTVMWRNAFIFQEGEKKAKPQRK